MPVATRRLAARAPPRRRLTAPPRACLRRTVEGTYFRRAKHKPQFVRVQVDEGVPSEASSDSESGGTADSQDGSEPGTRRRFYWAEVSATHTRPRPPSPALARLTRVLTWCARSCSSASRRSPSPTTSSRTSATWEESEVHGVDDDGNRLLRAFRVPRLHSSRRLCARAGSPVARPPRSASLAARQVHGAQAEVRAVRRGRQVRRGGLLPGVQHRRDRAPRAARPQPDALVARARRRRGRLRRVVPARGPARGTASRRRRAIDRLPGRMHREDLHAALHHPSGPRRWMRTACDDTVTPSLAQQIHRSCAGCGMCDGTQ